MSIFGAKKSAAVTPSYTGLQIQTASSALPIPIVYGKAKIAPNVIWYDDFSSTAQTSSAGKGGSDTVTGYDYSAAIIMALCEGPIGAITTVWKDQTNPTIDALGLTLFNGTTPQATWSYLTTAHPDQALSYPGTAYLASPSYDLGSAATVSNHNFELLGLFAGTAVNTLDADPAEIVSDFLVNPQYGVGFPGAAIDATTLFGSDGDASYQTYCWSMNLGLSPTLTDTESASSTLSRWLQLTNTAAVWSGGQIKFVPYGDGRVDGYGRTWIPNLAPVYNLTDDDFKGDSGDDPVKASRSDPYSVPNVQRIEVSDRGNSYNATPVEARDQAMIEAFGLRVGSSITAHEICDLDTAVVVAQLILQRALYVRVQFAFKLSWEYCLLEPMDLVTLTDPGLGLANTAARIVSVEEGDDGTLSITAEEFPQGAATAVRYPVQHANGTRINRGLPAGPVNPPILFEPPPGLTDGVAELWMAVSGGNGAVADPNWGGCNVWLSLDGASYDRIGAVSGRARQGVTTASLAAVTGIDSTGTLSVDLTRSGGALASASAVAAQNEATLCLVDDELLAFTTATLAGPYRYGLTSLCRGLDGSAPAAHASGARFARLDDAVFRYAVPNGVVGRTIYLKFQSFNVFQGGAQDLSDCVAYAYTPRGSGLFGPVSQALAIGTSLDFGKASSPASESDDWGSASDPYVTYIDLGSASS